MVRHGSDVGSRSGRRGTATAPVVENRVGTRTRASILVGELRGFTHLARRVDPEVAVGLLQAFYTAASDVAVAHRATIDRVVGDMFILLFQSTGARRDDGARAIRTGLGLQRAFLALRNSWDREGALRGGQLGLAMGIGSGQLILAELQGVPGVNSVPFGEPLARANRLCQSARAADVLIDEETYAAARRSLEREVVFTSREVSRRGRDALTAYKAQLRRAGLRVVSRGAATDPVCGRDVILAPAHEWRDYGGATFHFCSIDCAERFTDDPANWLP
jgi:class 3 adenylate cyclase/YHS domain-containing protein